jgi:hypothetical protein
MVRTRFLGLAGGAAGIAAIAFVAGGVLTGGAAPATMGGASKAGHGAGPAHAVAHSSGKMCEKTPGLPSSVPTSPLGAPSGGGRITSWAGTGSVKTSSNGIHACFTPSTALGILLLSTGLPVGGGLPSTSSLPGLSSLPSPGGAPGLPSLPTGSLPSPPSLPGGGLPSPPGLPGGGLPGLPSLPGLSGLGL